MKNVTMVILLSAATGSFAQENPFIYPAAGQSLATIEYDRYQCYRWAVTQTGIDPNALVAPKHQPKVFRNADEGQTAKGALVGTIAGAALGSLIDDHDSATLPGAIIGASIGSLVGANKEQQGANQARAQATAEARNRQQQALDYRQRKAKYERAFLACMEGRSYVIK